MRAWQYRERVALDDLHEVELPEPEPGPGEVLVRIKAAALNFRDLAIAGGRYHVDVRPPLIPLSDGAGDVVGLGEGVKRLQVGDLVCPLYLPDWHDGPVSRAAVRRRLGGPSDGVLVELRCFAEDEVLAVPSHLEPEEAATLPVAWVTSFHSLFELGRLRPGEVLVVQGSGGVSTAAIQLAAAAGVRVLAVTRDSSRCSQLRALGATDVLVDDGDARWPAAIHQLTVGGADAVLTVAGGDGPALGIAATGIGGRLLLVGYAGGTDVRLDVFEAIRHAITIHVGTAGHRRSFERMNRLIADRNLRPAIGAILPATEYRAAFDAVASGEQVGKVVLRL